MAVESQLTGLLTGVTQAPLDPIIGGTYEQRMLARGMAANKGLRRGLGILTGTNTQTTAEKAQEALTKLDPAKKEDRVAILNIVSQVNPERVPLLKTAFADRDKQEEAVAKTDAAAAITRQQAQERLDIQRLQAEASQTSAEASRLQAENYKGDLSVTAEKAINKAEDDAAIAGGARARALNLLSQYETISMTSGKAGALWEDLKKFLGTEDDVSRLKLDFTNFVQGGILAALPPGVASDKDIELASAGFPNKDWNPEQIQRWLKGQAKLRAIDSERARFKSKWISDNNGNASGWNDGWDEKRKEPGMMEAISKKYNLPPMEYAPEDINYDPNGNYNDGGDVGGGSDDGSFMD
jgi:hypothetical protein